MSNLGNTRNHYSHTYAGTPQATQLSKRIYKREAVGKDPDSEVLGPDNSTATNYDPSWDPSPGSHNLSDVSEVASTFASVVNGLNEELKWIDEVDPFVEKAAGKVKFLRQAGLMLDLAAGVYHDGKKGDSWGEAAAKAGVRLGVDVATDLVLEADVAIHAPAILAVAGSGPVGWVVAGPIVAVDLVGTGGIIVYESDKAREALLEKTDTWFH